MSTRDLEAPEDSIPLRLIVFSMTMICIGSSLFFIHTSWGVGILLVALALIGSMVAYQHRYEKQGWMQWVVLVGVLAVGANALNEFLHPINGAADFWGPVVHFVAGIFALHTFDLKSRSDINLSALLGAIILCSLSPIVRGIYFGGVVFAYICLGSAMLYFDCMSRTQHNWLAKPMLVAPVILTTGTEKKRCPSGSTNMTMALLPLLALIVFMAVPRSDNFIDVIVSSFKSLNLNGLMRLLPDFSKKNEVKKNPYNPDQMKKVTLPPKELPADKKGEKSKDKKPQAVSPEAKAKEAEKAAKKTPPAPPKKDPAKDAAKSPKSDPKSKAEAAAQKDAAKKDAAKAAAKLDPKKLEEQARADAKKANEKLKAKGGAGGQGRSGKPKSLKPLKPLSSAEAARLLSENFDELFPKDLNVDRVHNDQLAQLLLFRVTSTRLFFPRMTAFDYFDGEKWQRSKDNINSKIVEVKSDGGPNDKPKLRTNVEVDANGKPLKELTAEEEADIELASEKFFKDAATDIGFGADESVHYLISKSEKSVYDLRQAQAFRVPRKLPYVDLTQSYEMLIDIGEEVPSCWIPQSLGYGGSTAIVDDYGRISFPEKLKKGSTYKMTSCWPVNDLNAMREAAPLTAEEEGSLREKLANYLQLPENIDPAVKEFGDKAIGGTGNWFVQAQKLCMAVRSNSTLSNEDFVAPENRPQEVKTEAPTTEAGATETVATETVATEAQTGSSESTEEAPVDKVSDFLFARKYGDSRRFATAFCVLCRQQGLPSRVVVGFQPGTFNKLNGTYEVHGSDTFTWTEVFIPEYGWVAFDSTPDGVFPEQKRDEGYNFTALVKALEEQLGLNEGEGLTPKKIFAIVTLAVSCIFLIVGIVYGIILLRRFLKKRQEENRYRGPEWPVYLALLKDLKRLQIERAPTESQKQFVARVADTVSERVKQGLPMPQDLPAALGDFFEVYDAVHFGNKEGMSELKERAKVVRGLARSSKISSKDLSPERSARVAANKGRGKEGPTAAESAVRGGRSKGPRA